MGGGVDGWERGENTMGRESERGETGVTEGEGQRAEDFVKTERGKKKATEKASECSRWFFPTLIFFPSLAALNRHR